MIKDQYQFLAWLDPLVISGEVGVAKPAPAIYQILLRKVGVPAGNCIFIDDMAENIRAATHQGFGTIHFSSAENLRSELVGRGFLEKAIL